ADGFDDDAYATWLQLIGSVGGREDVAKLIEAVTDRGRLDHAIALTRSLVMPGDGESDPSTGDIAYAAAAIAAANDREAAAEAMYTVALEVDPAHGWSANNLGYTLLERGDDLDRAESLLEVAATALPEQASVLDSIGWLRYLQGRLEAPADADPNDPSTLGAISLLERASEVSGEGDGDGTIHDHLGDAYAAVGRLDEARKAWKKAAEVASIRVATLSARQNAGGPFLREVESIRDRARKKIRQLEEGRAPTIAPRLETSGKTAE
ncbi:MAG: hypothetical protein CMJ31_07740, partial [Phycisphaerae bacterium]|nr:hypothetical protein [Phycisphaerae bacterium]